MEYEKVNTLFDSDEAEHEHTKEQGTLQDVVCSMATFSLATPCLLCGKSIPIDFPNDTRKICEECKKIWQEIKEERGHHG